MVETGSIHKNLSQVSQSRTLCVWKFVNLLGPNFVTSLSSNYTHGRFGMENIYDID